MSTKYCPECGGEYQEWAQTCADCGLELTDTKPVPRRKTRNENEFVLKGGRKYVKEPLVPVACFANTLEAQFSQGILESEGIPSIITDADRVLLNGQNTSTLKGVSLVVKQSDAEKAKEILDSIERNLTEDGFTEDGSIEVIPMDNDDGPAPQV